MMTRIDQVSKEAAKEPVKGIYEAIEKKFGQIPNIFLNMGNSSAVLEGYLAFSDAANRTSLSPQLREKIALIVSEINQCDYCLSAHTAIAKGSGISQDEIIEARKGNSSDSKTQKILEFCKAVVNKKGHISDLDLNALKAAHITDSELVEIILVIHVNMFTNYFNHITNPKIDFPLAPKIS